MDNMKMDLSTSKTLYATNTEIDNVEDTGKKIAALKILLEKDPIAVDLKWSFFVAACNTYRCDSCLRPFPPMYIKNECKDIEAVRKAVELTPPLTVIYRELDQPNVYENYGAAIELLYWVLIKMRDPHIKSIGKKNYESVLRLAPFETSVAAPNLIFQIASIKQSTVEKKWKDAAQGHSTFYAYHGSRLENFHSIIHYGLQQNMCRTSLFGNGIYLSSELSVSLPYSPIGYGWGGSILGSDLSCVALCEVIDHPDVKRGDSGDETQRLVINSVGRWLPDKYCLVMNSELVRIRYLLVYTQGNSPRRTDSRSGVLTWIKQHKVLTLVLGYVVLLASVSISHNRHLEKYYRLFIQKAGLN